MQKLKNNKTQITCCRVEKIPIAKLYKYTAYKKNAHDSIYRFPIHMYVYMDMCAYKSVYMCVYMYVYTYIKINRLKISEKIDTKCLINYGYP